MSKLPKGKIVYRWENPSSWQDRTKQNEAREFIVIQDDDANSGVITYGLFNDEWSCNPWNVRPLLRHIIEKNKQLQAELTEWEEQEAAICPEDVGFVEYIKQLQAELVKANKQIYRFRKGKAYLILDEIRRKLLSEVEQLRGVLDSLEKAEKRQVDNAGKM